jgi:outer membrane protein assembly factor BamB
LYPEHPVGNKVGHFWCIDVARATELGAKNKDSDVSPKADNFDAKAAANKDSAMVWHFGGELDPRPKFGRSVHFGRTISTAAVHDGLVYIAEEMGYLHCLDAATGKQHWVHDFKTGIWGSPYWADGKVYMGTEDGDVFVFAHGKQKKELAAVYMEEAVPSTPVASGSTLYVATKSKLYAIGK